MYFFRLNVGQNARHQNAGQFKSKRRLGFVGDSLNIGSNSSLIA